MTQVLADKKIYGPAPMGLIRAVPIFHKTAQFETVHFEPNLKLRNILERHTNSQRKELSESILFLELLNLKFVYLFCCRLFIFAHPFHHFNWNWEHDCGIFLCCYRG